MGELLERQTNMPLAIVVAMGQNNVIGKGNGLPWRLSDDLKWFKQNTLGKPTIMGHNTYRSIGRALPGRDNVVITHQADVAYKDVTIAHDLEDAITIAEAFALARQVQEICIIGGGEIYRQALPLVKKIYLTRVAVEIDGDVFFPALDPEQWEEERVKDLKSDEKNDHDAIFSILTRRPEHFDIAD